MKMSKYKNYFKKSVAFRMVFAVIVTLLMFVGVGGVLDYVLVDDTSSYTRVAMHELHNSPQNVETLLVGSSHVYRSLVPSILDERLGTYSFNAGTSSQFIDGSLAMIQDALVDNEVKRIYLELYYGVATSPTPEERTQLTSTYIISDYMHPSVERLLYILNASTKEHYINSFIKSRRNWENIFNFDAIKRIVSRKNSYAYKNYIWPREDWQKEYYVERGFVANDENLSNPDWNSQAAYAIPMEQISAHFYEYLEKIVKLCQERDIELTFFITPVLEKTLIGKGNYAEYERVLQAITERYQIPVYDFNLSKPGYFDASDESLFKDEDHFNTAGAEKFSEVFGDFFAGKIDKNELFYPDFKAKLAAEAPKVYGLAGPYKNAKGESVARIISNCETNMEYEVKFTAVGGESSTLKEWSGDTSFVLPKEHGTISVVWRTFDDDAESHSETYSY